MNKDLNTNAAMKEIVIEAKIENLDVVQDFIANELRTSSVCPVKVQTQITLAVEEIFVNIARYAYGQNAWATDPPQSEQSDPATNTLTVRVAAAGDEIIIEYEDSGTPFNPLEINDPDTTLNIEEREVGGLGIFMVKKLMDAIKYRYEDNKNILLLIKKSDRSMDKAL